MGIGYFFLCVEHFFWVSEDLREASAEREKARSPAARVSLSTHALCP